MWQKTIFPKTFSSKQLFLTLCVNIFFFQSNQQILKEAASNSGHALYYESSSEEEELEEDAIVDNLTKNYQGKKYTMSYKFLKLSR